MSLANISGHSYMQEVAMQFEIDAMISNNPLKALDTIESMKADNLKDRHRKTLVCKALDYNDKSLSDLIYRAIQGTCDHAKKIKMAKYIVYKTLLEPLKEKLVQLITDSQADHDKAIQAKKIADLRESTATQLKSIHTLGELSADKVEEWLQGTKNLITALGKSRMKPEIVSLIEACDEKKLFTVGILKSVNRTGLFR